MKRVHLEPAYVLSLRPYRETSVLLEVFTAPQGRVGLVARGVRGPKSRQRGLLQIFRPLLLSWSEGGELGTLSGVEAAGPGVELRGEAVFSGWYLNELLLRLLQRRDPHAALFKAYAKTLESLGGAGVQTALRIFEKQLLAELGYGLQLPDRLEASRWYEYDEERGVHAVALESGHAYRGSSLIDLMNEEFQSGESLHDAKRLLRAALRPHLGDRELATPRMLRTLRAKTGTASRESGAGTRP